ncbi:MAG: Calx-beta domain-containing protein, partial [Arenimonas sp.]
CTPDNGVNPDTSPAVYASTSALLDHIEANALNRARDFMTTSKAMLQNNFSGIRLMSYEGGQHLAGIGQFTFDETCNLRFDGANRDPRMQTIYQNYLADWKANGDEFTHFINTGRWGVFGYWGALQSQDQPVSSSPKYTALTQHIAANPCHWANCTQTGPTLSINNVSISEGDSGTKLATFTVSLSHASASAITYKIATSSGGTATVTTDYTGKTLIGEIIPAGALSKTFSVAVKGDTGIEPNENFIVNITNIVGATASDSQGIGTITDDDTPLLKIDNISISEGHSATKVATFTVSLAKASSSNVSYKIATNSGGTATVTTDYTGKTLLGETILAGVLSKTFSVGIKGDTTIEANETFLVNLSNVVGATVADGQGVGTILNDDGPTLSINNVSVTEGNSGSQLATFTVSLSQASASPVTYTIATNSGGTATVTTDYSGKTLVGETINPGALNKTFTVAVKGDITIEANETFFVNISNISGATAFDSQGVGTIINND